MCGEVQEMKSQLGDENAASDVLVSFKLAMNVSETTRPFSAIFNSIYLLSP